MFSTLDTPFGPLLWTVFESILEVFLLCLAGYVLATYGVLDKRTQKQINRLNVSLFTPSLLFSKVAFFLSPAKLRELWIIPIFFVLVTAVSMAVAFILGCLFRLKRSQRSFAMAAAMFMNSNSLPIALMQSLVITVPGLKWGPDDNTDAMLGRALTYLVLFSTLGMIVRWSYGVHLLSQADPESNRRSESNNGRRSPLPTQETVFPPSSIEEGHVTHRHSSATTEVGDHEEQNPSDEERRPEYSPQITINEPEDGYDQTKKDGPFFGSFPNSPIRTPPGTNPTSPRIHSRDTLPSDSEEESDDTLTLPLAGRRYRPVMEPTSSRFASRLRRAKHRFGKSWRSFNNFMTVPLWASLLSLVVACIRPLQHILEVHVQPIRGALTAAGNCSIPLTLVVLGAYFYTPPEEGSERQRSLRPTASTTSVLSLMNTMKDVFRLKTWKSSARRSDDESSPTSSRPGEAKTVFVAVVSRMIITPLLILPLMALSTQFDLQDVFADPIFVVASVLLVASPPAVTLAQITQAASGDSFERLISRTIFWSYCVLTPPSTVIYVVIGLLLSKQ